MSAGEPLYGSIDSMKAVTQERQDAWDGLTAECQRLGIEVNQYSTNETLAWRIGAHLLRTMHDLLAEKSQDIGDCDD